MTDLHPTLFWAALAILAAGPAQAGDPLARYRDTHRVVLAMAADRSDPALARQRRLFAALGHEARERDLALVEVTDDMPEGTALRRRFGGAGFRAVLIGKDGGDKLVSDAPLGRDTLLATIDAMPMRRREMLTRP